MAQKQKTVSAAFACALIDQIIARNPTPLWGWTPDQLKQAINAAAVNDILTFNKASLLISNAETSKLRGDANRGLGWLRQELKHNYTGEI